MIKIVGQGSFGIVRQCKSLLNQQIYAIKSIPMNRKGYSYNESNQMAEVEIMKGLQHPNIIEYRGYFKDFDFCSNNKDPIILNEDEVEYLQSDAGPFESGRTS